MQFIQKREQFYLENTKKINKITELILLCSNLIPILFILLIKLNIFPISYAIPLSFLPFTILFFVSIHFFNKKEKFVKFVMYYGMICTSIFVGFLGHNSIINLYISFGFAPFLSCLYYDKKLNITVLIVNFVIVTISLFIRSFTGYLKDPFQPTPISYFITYLAGFIVEYIFVFLISNAITKRSYNDFEKLFKTQIEQENLIKRLDDSIVEKKVYFEQLQNQNKQLQETQVKIIQFISKILGSHDLFTGRHVLHTQKYVDIICRQLKKDGHYVSELTDENINLFTTAAFLHDIGKIHIPEGVLNKMGKFTDAEFKIMQCHPEEGVKLLKLFPKVDDGKFNDIAKDMCLYHHEKWDGSGYPNKIKGTEIPLCARIMACADVLDALISERLYKKPFSIEKAMEIFEESKGSHFEPCIAEAVIECKPLIFMIDSDFKSSEYQEQKEELKWWKDYHNELKTISETQN